MARFCGISAVVQQDRQLRAEWARKRFSPGKQTILLYDWGRLVASPRVSTSVLGFTSFGSTNGWNGSLEVSLLVLLGSSRQTEMAAESRLGDRHPIDECRSPSAFRFTRVLGPTALSFERGRGRRENCKSRWPDSSLSLHRLAVRDIRNHAQSSAMRKAIRRDFWESVSSTRPRCLSCSGLARGVPLEGVF